MLVATRTEKGYLIYRKDKKPFDSLTIHKIVEEGGRRSRDKGRETYTIDQEGFKRLVHKIPVHVVRNNSVFQHYILNKYGKYKYDKPKFEDKCDRLEKLSKLAPQQRFVRAYVTPQSVFKGLLLWHAAGTGKTCGAVGVASTFMEQVDPSWNVLWVSRRNLLHSPINAMFGTVCLRGLRRDIQQGKLRLKDVNNPDFWPVLQRRYAKQLPKYKMIRYSKFVKVARRARNPDDVTRILRGEEPRSQGFVQGSNDPFRRTLVIIDEAHNLYNTTDFTDDYDDRVLHKENGIKDIEQAIWRSYRHSGQDSCRLLLMTATPMTKSPTDLFRLINLLIPIEKNRLSLHLSHYIHQGKISKEGKKEYQKKSMGLVSYFNGDRDPRYFAMKKWGYMINAAVSDVQVKEFRKCEVIDKAKRKSLKRVECFRQKSNIAKLRGKGFNFSFDSAKWDWRKLRKGLKEYAPKLRSLMHLIHKLDKQDLETRGRLFKHVIYTDVTSQGYGSKAVASVFKAYGYARAWNFTGYRNKTKLEPAKLQTSPLPFTKDTKEKRKSFAVLSKTAINVVESEGDEVKQEGSDVVKQEVSQGRTVATLDLFNDPTNVHGKKVRFIILDSTFKEGIDLMDVKYVHILEPPLNQSSYKQVAARAARRCGSKGLPYRHNRGWQVVIYMYRSVYPSSPSSSEKVGGGDEGDKDGFKSIYSLEMESVKGASTMRLMDQFENLAMHSSTDYLLNKPILNFEPYQGFQDAIKIGSTYIG